MYQKTIVIGNLGRDPEMRYTPNGTPVTSFSLASSHKYKDSSGQLKDETLWFRVTAWNKQAEICNEYLSKGSRALVEGSLIADESGSPRIWTGQDGKPRASFEIRADRVVFLSAKQTQPASQVEETPAVGAKTRCKMCGETIVFVGPYWDHPGEIKPRHPALPVVEGQVEEELPF